MERVLRDECSQKLTPIKTPRSFKPPTATQAAGMGSSAKFFRVVITESMVQEARDCAMLWNNFAP